MKHLFIDFAMAGYHPADCVVFDCSMVIVDDHKMISDVPYTVADIAKLVNRFKLDVKDQVATHNFVLHEDGLSFWSAQPKAIRNRVIAPGLDDLPVNCFVEAFVMHLEQAGKIDRMWSWNSMDDACILWRLFEAVGKGSELDQLLPRRVSRDFVTFLDAKFGFKHNTYKMVPIEDQEFWSKLMVTEIDTSTDVIANALRMQATLRAEEDLPPVVK